MDTPGGRSAIVVPFALPAPLEAIRRDHVDNARLGVPAHVTLLFPFIPAESLDAMAVERAAKVIGEAASFEVAFASAASFESTPGEEGVVWLAPEPREPFVDLTHALSAAFPDYLPYGGLHDTVIPHLTLANVDVEVPALVPAAQAHLPFARRVEAAALLVEDAAGRWRIARELPLS